MVVDGLLHLRDGGEINGLTNASGRASSILVMAQDLTIDGLGADSRRRSQIISNTGGDRVSGDGGSIDVQVADRLELRDGARIVTLTQQGGTGDAGPISINARDIALSGASVISASTGSVGNASTVTIAASHGLSLVGENTRITSNARSTGRAGSVVVAAGSIDLRDGGQITSDTSGSGDAGAVTVDASDIVIGRGASISTGTSAQGAQAGKGGRITLSVGRSLTLDGGGITSSSTGAGDGGNITIAARGADVRLLGVDARNELGRVRGTGEISASAQGSGRAGNISVLARDLAAQDGSIRTTSTGAEGGRIEVRASRHIFLRGSEIAADGKDSRGGTSVMTIRAPTIVLSDGQMTSLTQGRVAAGSGEVTVTGDDVTVVSADSRIQGSTKTEITGLQSTLGSDLQLSPSIFLDTSSLLQPSCADRGAARSTFTRSGRGGLPPAPDRPLPSVGADGPGVERLAAGGTVFLDGCAGSLVSGTNS